MLNDTDCIAEGGITVASVSPAWPGHVLSRGSQSSEVAPAPTARRAAI